MNIGYHNVYEWGYQTLGEDVLCVTSFYPDYISGEYGLVIECIIGNVELIFNDYDGYKGRFPNNHNVLVDFHVKEFIRDILFDSSYRKIVVV